MIKKGLIRALFYSRHNNGTALFKSVRERMVSILFEEPKSPPSVMAQTRAITVDQPKRIGGLA